MTRQVCKLCRCLSVTSGGISQAFLQCSHLDSPLQRFLHEATSWICRERWDCLDSCKMGWVAEDEVGRLDGSEDSNHLRERGHSGSPTGEKQARNGIRQTGETAGSWWAEELDAALRGQEELSAEASQRGSRKKRTTTCEDSTWEKPGEKRKTSRRDLG